MDSKKKTTRRALGAVDKAKSEMEEELCRKLDEDSGKKIIYKMAHERDEDSKDVKAGTVIKDRNRKLVQTGKRHYMYRRSTSRHC